MGEASGTSKLLSPGVDSADLTMGSTHSREDVVAGVAFRGRELDPEGETPARGEDGESDPPTAATTPTRKVCGSLSASDDSEEEGVGRVDTPPVPFERRLLGTLVKPTGAQSSLVGDELLLLRALRAAAVEQLGLDYEAKTVFTDWARGGGGGDGGGGGGGDSSDRSEDGAENEREGQGEAR